MVIGNCRVYPQCCCCTLIRVLVFVETLTCISGWIALSPDGYEIKQNFIIESGVSVDGQIVVNGVIVSAPVTNLECNSTRQGALRWNDKFFEGCDGTNDWRPITFCSRSCDINTDAVPCGLAVTDTCGVGCQQSGTGLNMLHCILRVATTPCGEPVTDQCSNVCGLAGGYACDSSPVATGAMLIKSLNTSNTAAFQLTTARPSADPSGRGLVLSYKDVDGTDQDLLVFGPAGGPAGGLAISPPAPPAGASGAEPTLRISMPVQLTGDIVELGRSAAGAAGATHIFVDGAVDKECPFVFNGGRLDGAFTTMCLEVPTASRTITAPDADGVMITSGNREDVTSLPGLRGDNVLVFTGDRRAPAPPWVPPPPPRVACAGYECNASVTGFSGQRVDSCPPNTVRRAGGPRPLPRGTVSRPGGRVLVRGRAGRRAFAIPACGQGCARGRSGRARPEPGGVAHALARSLESMSAPAASRRLVRAAAFPRPQQGPRSL